MTSPIVDGVLAGLLAGLATGLGALGVYSVRELSRRANDLLLACAAGVMLFVISGEIIPETHRGESKGLATYALLAGFLTMTALNLVLA